MGDSVIHCSIQTHKTSPHQISQSMNQISNQDLKLEEIPDPDGNWNQWVRFAHTINGYEVQGGFEPCADLANGGEIKTLTELRCALFFEARRERHSGGLTDVSDVVKQLLREIRRKVADQKLE